MENYIIIKKNLIRMLILSMLPTEVFSASPETKQMIQSVLSKYCIPNDKTLCNTPYEGKYDPSLSFCLCNDDMIWNGTDRKYQECNAGTYYKQNMRDNTCKSCSPGSYSWSGASSCTSCSPGTYQPSSGQGSCLNCDTSSCYTSGVGATSCYYRCGGGSPYCNGSGSCVECTSDSHCNGNRTCSGSNCVCNISCLCGTNYSDCSCESCPSSGDSSSDSSGDSGSSGGSSGNSGSGDGKKKPSPPSSGGQKSSGSCGMNGKGRLRDDGTGQGCYCLGDH